MAINQLANLSGSVTAVQPLGSVGAMLAKSQPGRAVPQSYSGLPQAVSERIHPMMQRYLTDEDKVILSEAYEQSKNERNGQEKAVRLALRYATVRYGADLLARGPVAGGDGLGTAWTGRQTPLAGALIQAPVRQALATLIEWQLSSRQAQATRRYGDIAKAN
jgi:hypothetical protein